MSSQNKHLFKERITKSGQAELAAQLKSALTSDEQTLMKLLFGEALPKEYAGTYQEGQHNKCDGFAKITANPYEKRICKCLYYHNSKHPKRCETCKDPYQFDIIGDYRIVDYEVPAFYDGPGIGEIDLVLSGDEKLYAVEVKPPKQKTPESLLRMIAEIITYTVGFPEGKYRRAIAFFEDSPQEIEYQNCTPELPDILQQAKITVFRFEKHGGNVYKICKL